MFEEKEIIYVAHPCAGKEENKERIDRIMNGKKTVRRGGS